MRNIVCPICNIDKSEVVFESSLPPGFDESHPPLPYSAHYRINRCLGCNLTYSSPIMDDSGVSALYRHSSETNVIPGEEGNVRRTMALYYKHAAKHLRGRGRMIDVGCDMGYMLEIAKDDGFAELHGTEPNPIARAVAERVSGASG